MATLKAILGPTNTGKTHYAIERMLGYSSGMIGLPLRLLAREVYDRIVAIKGAPACALITGEERIEPANARYYVCTVESMPMTKAVSFMAVDEIQIAEHRDRGHVFTDRILHARGTEETLLLGAETMRSVLRELDLHAETDTRERFSELKYSGPTKVTKLPKRTAIVAFSSQEVYAIAELLRRQKGGAAVVMGALSPRTRNAQVELYQSGEVDYLVATDAIGMGLNLDVDHIAFASRSKFDGQRRRQLSASECAQVAGRAGRYMESGTFGETGDCPQFYEETVQRIEHHNFEPIDLLQWRNTALDYSSLASLMTSLSANSGHSVLRQNPNALDEWTLRRMAEDDAIGPDIQGKRNVQRLWDLARLPDFRKAGHDGHARLVLGLAETLADPDARLSDAAMAHRLEHLAMTAGDISKLQERLAAIRTWSYVAHREDWLANPQLWRDKTRAIEDNLSDALHLALTARFVDRRTTALMASLKKDDTPVSNITSSGEVSIEGHVVGKLVGLNFKPESHAKTLEGKTLRGAAQAALKPILARRLEDITNAQPAAFMLGDDGDISFDGETIARLTEGKDWLVPNVELIGGEDAEASARDQANARLATWILEEISRILPTHNALTNLNAAKTLEGLARGIAFRLMEAGAAIDLRQDDPAHRLTQTQREALKALGLRAGRVAAHVPDAQKPAAQRLISILRTANDGVPCPPAPEGAGSFPIDDRWTAGALAANGYLQFGARAVRADLAERLGWEISKRRKEAGKNAFALPPELASIVSCPGVDFPGVLSGYGLAPAERDKETELVTLWRYAARAHPADGPKHHGRKKGPVRNRTSGKPKRTAKPQRQPDPNSPFAALAVLVEKPKPKPSTKKRKPKSKPATTEGAPAKKTNLAK